MAHKYNLHFIFGISVISALGGLLFGYDWVVIGGAKPFYEAFFGIADSPVLQGWTMSSALAGCILGATSSGFISEKLGRKRSLMLSALLFTISAFGTGMSDTLPFFNLYRVVGGLGIGLTSTQSPLYIAEISPGEMRGKLVALNQFTIVIGILTAQLINFWIADKVVAGNSQIHIGDTWNGQYGWRWMFWVESVPAVSFLLMTFFIPESPRWLAKKERWYDSKKVLERIGGSSFTIESLNMIKQSILSGNNRINYESLHNIKIRPVLILGIVLAVFQQWCGINVIFNYAEEVFTAAGYGISDILFNIILTGIVNLVFTIFAMLTVDKWGRKKLLLFGGIGLAATYFILGTLFFLEIKGMAVVIFVVTAIAIYAMTLAPVTWVVLSEIFPNRIRSSAMALATTALWIACFILTYTFPALNKWLGASGTFWLYAAICIAGYIYIKHQLIETKGKSLEEIEAEIGIK